MGLHDEAKLDVKFTDFAKQMNLYLNHFPKHEKYGLSQVIRNKAYEVYGFIVESQKRYQKRIHPGPRPPHGQLCPSFANPKRKIP